MSDTAQHPGPVLEPPPAGPVTVNAARHDFIDNSAKYLRAAEHGSVVLITDDAHRAVAVLRKPRGEEPP